MNPNCQCSKCKAEFYATGFNIMLVLSGGADCPNCGKKEGINIVVAEIKKRKK